MRLVHNSALSLPALHANAFIYTPSQQLNRWKQTDKQTYIDIFIMKIYLLQLSLKPDVCKLLLGGYVIARA